MLITNIKINNFEFRNGNPINFFIGDNGVGKSNLLELFNIIFNKSSFYETKLVLIVTRTGTHIS